MSSDRHDPENENENSASEILPRPCLARQVPGTSFFLLFSAHAFERNCENTKTAWSGDSTTENAIYDENMKIIREKIEAYLEKSTSNNRKSQSTR